MKKAILIVFSLLILSGLYLFSFKRTHKIYTDSGVSFMYPADYKVQTESLSGANEIKRITVKPPFDTTDGLSIVIESSTLEKYEKSLEGDSPPYCRGERTIVGPKQIPAIETGCGDGPWSVSSYTFQISPNKILHVSYGGDSNETRGFAEVFNHILQTLTINQ